MSRYLPGIIAGIVTFVLFEVVASTATTALTWGFWALLLIITFVVGFKLSRRVRR